MKEQSPQEVLYGLHAVSAALDAGRRKIHCIYIMDKKKAGKSLPRPFSEILQKARKNSIPVSTLTVRDFQSLTRGAVHQGIAAHVGPYPFVPLDDLLADVSQPPNSPFFLIADTVVDPHNLGALIRTALCAGADGLIIPKDNAASPTAAVAKVSAGAVEHLRIARVTNLARTIHQIKETGIWVAGLDMAGEKTVYEYDLTGPVALVVGGEGKGIRRLVSQACDFIMAIPQAGPVESLNVSVAGGIAMYEVCRQRLSKDVTM
ncbi:MAG: 23S rRNA (guanosine(2251)-2'-O)-methyltransferase RlmB [Thermodesulfobacteriota bacterium]|nr:23S rRNA (guanosine(2251)-2'-O)-methyltransferase RlmB [Thermodesulfobacteriota bacterium]